MGKKTPPHKQQACTAGHHAGFTFHTNTGYRCARCGAPPAEANGIDTDQHHVNGVLLADGTWRAAAYTAGWSVICTYTAPTWEAAARLCEQHMQAAQTCDVLGMETPSEAELLAAEVMAF